MAPRISFFEPLSDGPASLQAPLQSDQTETPSDAIHLESLVRAGVVTHQIPATTELDPLFAVSQIKDLPEVTFVAAFQSGFIALGCPNGPPESLESMIEICPKPATEPPATAPVTTAIEDLKARFDALESSLARNDDVHLQRLESVSHRLEFAVDHLKSEQENRSSDPDTAQTLIDLFTQHAADIRQAQDDGFSHLRTHLSETWTAAQTRDDPLRSRLDGLGSAFQRLADQVAQQVASPPKHDTGLSETLAAMRGQLGGVYTSISQLDEGLGRLNAQGADRSATLNTLSKKLDTLNSADAQQEILSALKEAATQRQASIAQNDLMEKEIRASESAQKEQTAQLAHLVEKVDALCEAGSTNEKQPTLSPETLEKLTEQVQTLVEQAPPPIDTSAIAQAAAEAVNAHLDYALPSHLQGLHTDLKKVANQPTPALDLTEQRRSFAGFSNVLSAIAKKLDTTANRIADETSGASAAATSDLLRDTLNDWHGGLTAETDTVALKEHLDLFGAQLTEDLRSLLETQHTHLQGALSAQEIPDQTDTLAALQDDIAHVPAKLDALRDLLVQNARQPGPMLDLTAQRESFARFGTAMSVVVGRLEAAIDRTNTSQQNTNQDITAVLQALPEALHLAVAEAQNAEMIDQSFAGLRDDIAHIGSHLNDLEEVKNGLATMARRPDPVLDLTAQHKGFARFGTAVAKVVNRLENVSEQFVQMQSETGLSETLVSELAEFKSALTDKTEQQSRQLAGIEEHLKTLSKAPTLSASRSAEPSDPSTETLSSVPDNMRFLLAEVIAQQIKANSGKGISD